jgi:hypothetical protein
MSIKEITTNIEIPYSIFQSNQSCFNVLNEISNNIFNNMNTNLLNGGKNKNKRKNIKRKRKTLKNKKKNINNKNKKINKNINNNKSKKYYKLKGGTKGAQLFMLIIIFLTFNSLTTDSLLFTNDSNVIERIVEAGKKSLFFKNSKGTCASNILFFLKSISLETHVFNLLNTVKMNNQKIEKELSINATLKTTWVEFSLFDALDDTVPKSINKDQIIHEQFNSMIQTSEGKNELVKLYISKLQKFCSSIGRGFITLLVYPTTGSINHAVALWYTETGNIIIIDPQLFDYYNAQRKLSSIEIYSDVNDNFEKYNAGSGIRVYSLKKYISDNVIVDDYIYEISYLLEAKHFELNDNITAISDNNPYYEKGLKLLEGNKPDL